MPTSDDPESQRCPALPNRTTRASLIGSRLAHGHDTRHELVRKSSTALRVLLENRLGKGSRERRGADRAGARGPEHQWSLDVGATPLPLEAESRDFS